MILHAERQVIGLPLRWKYCFALGNTSFTGEPKGSTGSDAWRQSAVSGNTIVSFWAGCCISTFTGGRRALAQPWRPILGLYL